MRRRLVLFALLSISNLCHAQQGACGLTSMTESPDAIYPPIARAAHVYGPVVMLATFETTGEVVKIEVISGPEMLRAAAVEFVKTWHANSYTGPRTCPVVVTFADPHPTSRKDPPRVVRLDPQHVVINLSYFSQPQTASQP